MVLLKCARKYQILSHKSHTHIYVYMHYIHILQLQTHTLTQKNNIQNTLASLTHAHKQTFKLDVLFLLNLLASSRALKVCSFPCIREHYFVFCWLFGTYSLLMAEHNMPIESIIAVDFLMIATIVLFFYAF